MIVCKHCQKEIKAVAGAWYEVTLFNSAIFAEDILLAAACSNGEKLCSHEPEGDADHA